MVSSASIKKQRWLHFLLLGALLLGAEQFYALWQSYALPYPSPAEIELSLKNWRQAHGRFPNAEQKQALIQQELDERMLLSEAYRRQFHLADPLIIGRLIQDADFLKIQGTPEEKVEQALMLDLHRGDELIRRRLIERMRTWAKTAQARFIADETELRQRYADDLDRWRSDTRYSFEHVFLSRDQADSPVLMESWREQLDTASEKPGHAFLYGDRFTQQSAKELRKQFGAQFVEGLQALTSSSQWQGPITSRYGWHLVRLDEIHAGEAASYETVRASLYQEWRQEQEKQRLEKYLAALRKRYRWIES